MSESESNLTPEELRAIQALEEGILAGVRLTPTIRTGVEPSRISYFYHPNLEVQREQLLGGEVAGLIQSGHVSAYSNVRFDGNAPDPNAAGERRTYTVPWRQSATLRGWAVVPCEWVEWPVTAAGGA
jgi:hypothetical protein